MGQYLDVLAREWELYGSLPAVAGRPLNFVYFGGGTPSFLSTAQLQGLVKRLTKVATWNQAEEITFECEPGTLTESKLSAIRRMGVTRLSLGVENFDDRILDLNGRAHRSPEIGQAYRYARSIGFPQINIDLIAGMLGETDANWARCVQKTLELEPDSVTIYQMELPFNTTISKDLLKGTRLFSEPVASWPTKRRWTQEAFEALERWGMQPALVRGTAEALAALRLAAEQSAPVPLVVMDLHMPEVEGFRLVERIQQEPQFRDPQVILLTSAGRRGDGARCRELGIAAYLSKPIRQPELLQALPDCFIR